MKFLRYIKGYCEITVQKENAAAALSLLVREKIPFTRTENDGENVRFCVPYKFPAEEKLGRLCEKIRRRSLLHTLFRYRKRAGLAVGAILAAVLIYLSTLFVWDIRVIGAENVPEDEIISLLARRGFCIGTYIPDTDKERLALEITMEDGRFSWFKINMRGTVAVIDLHERTGKDMIEAVTPPSNLVSAYDAQIELLDVKGGATVVKGGQIVHKGDLLVSGIIDSQAIGYRLVRARGSVYGRVTLEYETKIPVTYNRKIRKNTVAAEKNLKFFSKNIKVFKNDRISSDIYDIIEKTTRAELFGVQLPFFLNEKQYVFYDTKETTRTQAECLREAYRQINLQSEAELDNAEILSRHTEIDFSEEYLTMREQVECIIDIAKEIKISG